MVNTEKINPHLTAMIVKSYVVQHRVRSDQLSDLITSVQQALGQLGQPVQPEEVRTPAVSVRRSVHQDYVVCLDCGYRGKTLRRHISTRHGLSRDEYLKRWGLRSDHPLTAPAYSERRSTMAKALGFGRKSTAEVAPAATPTPVTVDQGSEVKPARRRSRAASTSADVTSEAVAEPKPTAKRRPRSASKSLTADGGHEVVAEPTPSRQRRSRSPVRPPKPEQGSSPTAEPGS
jgi:MucR family transcriptional regulator, transcriptional regulator of exopolysaccharide biosynthesis